MIPVFVLVHTWKANLGTGLQVEVFITEQSARAAFCYEMRLIHTCSLGGEEWKEEAEHMTKPLPLRCDIELHTRTISLSREIIST